MSSFGGGSGGPRVPGVADPDGGVRAIHIDDLPQMEQGEGTLWRPIRRALELTGVSANAYTGVGVGDEVIEHHDELSPSAGAHEELYLVTSGRATFVVDGAEVDAPVGTLIAIDVGQTREATAAEPDTTVLVVGGKPGSAYPPAPFEYWYAAEPSYLAGDYEGGIVVLSEGLEHHPKSPGLNYQLACHNALAGRGDDAIEHLRVAIENSTDGKVSDWAAEDDDLDSIRDHGDWPL